MSSIRPIKLLHREVFPEELYPLITVTLPDGKVQFNFANGVLDVDPGEYEGEIVVDQNGSLQTVYDVLRFRVRSNF